MLQFVVKFPSSPRPPMRVRPYAPTSETPLGPLGAAPRYIRAGRKTVVKLRSKKEINEEWRGEFPLLLLRSQSHHSLVDFENCKPSAEEEGASRYDVRRIFRFFDPFSLVAKKFIKPPLLRPLFNDTSPPSDVDIISGSSWKRRRRGRPRPQTGFLSANQILQESSEFPAALPLGFIERGATAAATLQPSGDWFDYKIDWKLRTSQSL